MKDVVSQFAMQLTLAEKRELVAELKGAIAEELASRASGPAGPSRCPRCGSLSLVRKGRDRDGGQRWLCRGCARTSMPTRPARIVEAARVGMDVLRRVHGRRAPPAGDGGPRRGLPLHGVVHAHAGLRGHGAAHPGLPAGDLPRRRHPGHGQPEGEPGPLGAPQAPAAPPPQRARRQEGVARAVEGVGGGRVRRQRARRLLLRHMRARVGGRGRALRGARREDPRGQRRRHRRAQVLRLRGQGLPALRGRSEGPLRRGHQHGQRPAFPPEGVPAQVQRRVDQEASALPRGLATSFWTISGGPSLLF